MEQALAPNTSLMAQLTNCSQLSCPCFHQALQCITSRHSHWSTRMKQSSASSMLLRHEANTFILWWPCLKQNYASSLRPITGEYCVSYFDTISSCLSMYISTSNLVYYLLFCRRFLPRGFSSCSFLFLFVFLYIIYDFHNE
jgi:hypothetical protein